MKKILFLLPLVALMAACGSDEAEGPEIEEIEFKTEKERISYAFGVENAKSIFRENMNADMLDKNELTSGFNSNLSANEPIECQEILMKFLGPYGQDFDTTMVESGSECMGKYTAAVLYMQLKQIDMVEEIDMEMVKKGFKHGVLGTDTVNMTSLDRQNALTSFDQKARAKMQQKQEEMNQKNIAAGPAFWEKVKSTNGVRQIGSSGIYVETVELGSGGKPSANSDVDVHYTLTNALGDTIETSIAPGRPSLKINLGSVIPGWTEGLQALQKGGIYRIFIPSDKAYKQGPLCFYIEFNDFGPAGSLAPPPQQMPQQQMY